MFKLTMIPEFKRVELKKPVLPIAVLFGVLIVGTIGYHIIWAENDSTLLDDLFMTFVTIATIGYNEIYPLDAAGRVFTMIIGVLGIGSLFYVMSIFMENLFIIQLYDIRRKRSVKKKISRLKDHIILAGLGRVGRLAAGELIKRGVDFVVIDEVFDDDIEEIFGVKLLTVKGDASEDNVLINAGIEKARGVIVATANSATTVFCGVER